MDENTLKNLEAKINQLVEKLKVVSKENELLRQSERALLDQRSKLLEKNSIARSKVESIIERLKSKERDSYH